MESLPIGHGGTVCLGSSCPRYCLRLRPTTVMREVEYARRERGRLGGWWLVLGMGLILVCCVWPGISLEGLGNAAAGIHRTLSADPCDTLQEVRRKNKDLRKELSKLPWPELRCFSAEGHTHGLPLRAEGRELSQRPAKARLEYLAGFFDGDGCVSCVSNMSGCKLKVSQSYDQAEVLMFFREAFGGSIGRERDGMCLRKPMRQWQLCGDSARRAARLLAPRSITKQKQLLIAARWPKTKSRREDSKAELRNLKEYDSAVAAPCSWEYCAGLFDAEGSIKQPLGEASLVSEIQQKYPTVLKCLGDFLSRSLGIDASLRKVRPSSMMHALRTCGLSDCKRILHGVHEAGLMCKVEQAGRTCTRPDEAECSASMRLADMSEGQPAVRKEADWCWPRMGQTSQF